MSDEEDPVNSAGIAMTPDGPRHVPYPCEACGEAWSPDEQHLGARYWIGGRWLCPACRTLH